LIYAKLAASADPDRATRFRERARRFATDWEARFDASGRVVPYGRSLTYRFAVDAFWGALAFAEEEALPWGQTRGLWAKHLRWWTDKPIWRADGTLSIGWTYPDLLLSETYNGPGSPYWAFKAFLPLATPAEHPFWSVAEAEDAGRATRSSIQWPAVAIVNRDDQQAQMLNGGRGLWFPRQGAAKYGKFAYSSAFAFGLDPDDPAFSDCGDSMLVLRDGDGERRVRAAVTESGLDSDGYGEDTHSVVWARWQPYSDVEIVTVLCGAAPWHARIHHIRTNRALDTFEGGFAIQLDDDPARPGPAMIREASSGAARVRTSQSSSLIADKYSGRLPVLRDLQPNTNLRWPRAVVPGLTGSLAAGTHVLACVVAAVEAPKEFTIAELPPVPARAWQVLSALTGVHRSALDDGL
jgi:hypothetical protein